MHDATRADSTGIDWGEIRALARRRLEVLIDARDRDDLDDLVQEICIRYLRVARREGIDDPDGLVMTLARRTHVDHIRRGLRIRRRSEALEREYDAAPVPSAAGVPDPLGSLIDRLPLIVQEVFREHGRDECVELLNLFCSGRPWSQGAAERGVAPPTLRKRWSRCLDIARSALSADPLLAEHVRSGG